MPTRVSMKTSTRSVTALIGSLAILSGAAACGTQPAVTTGEDVAVSAPAPGAIPVADLVPGACYSSASLDTDGTGYADPVLALQYMIDLQNAQLETLRKWPKQEEVAASKANYESLVKALQDAQKQAVSVGAQRIISLDNTLTVLNADSKVTSRVAFTVPKAANWNVATISFANPAVTDC